MMSCVIFVDGGAMRGKIRQAELRSRLITTDAVERKRNCGMAATLDPSETLSGKRNRAATGGADISDESPAAQEKYCRASDLHLPFVVGQHAVKGHAQRWSP